VRLIGRIAALRAREVDERKKPKVPVRKKRKR
jgi:hypothetical protein